MEEAKRIEWIDAAKGLSIILVVVGHVFPAPVGPTFRLLRMPLFFFLSGYVFKPRAFGDFLWKRANSLLVPHLVYLAVLSAVIAMLTPIWTDVVQPESFGRAHPVIGTLWGGTHANDYFLAYWFLPALFLALLLLNTILNTFGSITDWRTITSVLLISGIGLTAAPIDLPFDANIAPIALLFVWSGSLYRKARFPFWVTVGAGILLVAGVSSNDLFDMRSTAFIRPWLSFPAALAACHLAALGSQTLIRVDWIKEGLTAIGRASLVILLLHETVNLLLNRNLGVPPLLVFPLAIFIPYLCFIAFSRMNWVGQWLLLGRPPEQDRFSKRRTMPGQSSG